MNEISGDLGSDQSSALHPQISKPALYRCTSIENNWPHRHARYADVRVQWFVTDRPSDYAEQFAGFCDLTDPYSRGVIQESFTADEALQFSAYLKENHKSDVRIESTQLPVPPNVMCTAAIAVGGTTDFHMLSEEEGYSLPFGVWGFYDVCDARLIARSEDHITRAAGELPPVSTES
jgi:hypothetical protein